MLSYAGTLPGTQPTDADLRSFANEVRPGVSMALEDDAALKRLIFVAELRSLVQGGCPQKGSNR